MKKALISILIVVMLVASACPVQAKTIKGTSKSYACRSGKYIYYAFSTEGSSTDLMRFNTETGSKKTIYSNVKDGITQNGFREINVKGKYIYCTWNTTIKGVKGDYIYRIDKKGKGIKRLVCGRNPVIIKGRIYYDQCKKVKSGGLKYIVPTGKTYSMKLNGTDKKIEENVVLKKSVVSYNYSGKQKKVSSGEYGISISEKGDSLIRWKNFTSVPETGNNDRDTYQTAGKHSKEKTTLLRYPGSISSFVVLKDYIVTCGKNKKGRFIAYCIKNSGAGKVKLASLKYAK